eukprot:TRINITY_DN6648_c0_g1_i4.p1 TRINITY_DN6648_c0_g1~~TRINITY_DN6648_c0_g1_i4.p1  ORF type:complete len:2434 (-),score=604.51 TRINITY_DN6648_c0_g1_i4:24-7325(-)
MATATHVYCNRCGNIICSTDDVCFYLVEKAVHLGIKSERVQQVLTHISRVDNPKKNKWSPYKLKCSCGSMIGNVMINFRPMGKEYCTFDPEDTRIIPQGRKEKWSALKERGMNIDTRDTSAIAVLAQKETEVDLETVVRFPSDPSDIRSLCSMKPRDYQVELFLKALDGNSILFLPTGLGKTLVAAMLIKYMLSLNGKKKALFLVDRVPLVFQQGNYLQEITGLEVKMLCGENATEEERAIVCKGTGFDVLVATAGLVNGFLRDKSCLMGEFSILVIDEAHHARGDGHPFSVAMGYYGRCSHKSRPLILALTASPADGNSTTQMNSAIDKLSSKLCAPNIIAPSMILNAVDTERYRKDVHWENVHPSPEETELESQIDAHLVKTGELIKRLLKVTDLPEPENSAFQNAMIKLAFGESKRHAEHALKIFSARDANRIVGPFSALKILCGVFKELQSDKDLPQDLRLIAENSSLRKLVEKGASPDLSSRAQLLVETIEKNLEKYKDPRILVFVKTRKTAKALRKLLQSYFEDLAPSIITGQAKADGMTWEEQKEALDLFSCGETKLLVATNVVEEGLDVSSCSFVVSFDGVDSLKSFIQARGRGRKEGSEFFVISNRSKLALEDLVAKELMKLDCLKARGKTSQEVLNMLDKWNILIAAEPAASGNLRHCSLLVRLDRGADSLKELKKLKKLLHPDAVVKLDLIKHDDETLVVQLASSVAEQDLPLKIFNKLKEHRYQCWFRREAASSNPKRNAADISVEFTDLQAGIMVNRYEFEGDKQLGEGTLTLRNTTITAKLCLGSKTTYQMTFPLHSIDGGVLISICEDVVHLVISLKRPPSYSDKNRRRCFQDRGQLDYKFTFKCDLDALLDEFSKYPIDVYYATFESRKHDQSQESPQASDPDSEYLFRCLCSVSPALRRTTSQQTLDEISSAVLLSCLPLAKQDRFATLTELIANSDREVVQPDLPTYVRIPRVFVTPTRIVFCPPQLVQSNRILRKFHDKNEPTRFIRVQFCDEDFSLMRDISPWWKRRVRSVLEGGISVAHREFSFLGSSSSQLRRFSCWFFSESDDITVQNIREWSRTNMEELPTTAQKYQRFGLSLSSSHYIGEVSEVLENQPDIEDENYKWSDGIGVGSEQLAERVKESMGLSRVPSAVQYRLGGNKGVFTVYSSSDFPKIAAVDLYLRKSSFKFSSDYRGLDVISVPSSSPCYLNRQIIILLSTLGVPDQVFLDLQERQIADLSELFINEKVAKRSIRNTCDLDLQLNLVHSVCNEPFFHRLLSAIYSSQVELLRTRSRIFVEKGRNLLGVLDETESLEEGQIFVQFSYEDEETQLTKTSIVTGKTVVCKNPCLSPGEIRQLEAIDAPRLRHLVDVIVFPAPPAARRTRPHTDECSGSDLDGDRYFVCWDSKLQPNNFTAATEYEKGQAAPKDLSTWEDYFVDALANESRLGQIANEFIVRADRSPKKAFDDMCVYLAEQHFVEVDFPKTGIHGNLPEEKIKEYPHFMEKEKEGSYHSDQVLGRLFDRVSYLKDLYHSCPIRVNADLLHDGYENYKEEAVKTYRSYRAAVRGLVNLYNIETEEEAFTGCFRRLPASLKKDKNALAKALAAELEFTRKKYRRKFFLEFGEGISEDQILRERNEDVKKKASAWYFAAYSDISAAPAVSFPWIFADVLGTLPAPAPAADQLRENLLATFSTRKNELLESFQERLALRKEIETALSADGDLREVFLYGSSAVLLFDSESDVDLFVHSASKNDEVEQLQKLAKSIETKCRDYNTEVIKARIPIVKGSPKKNDGGLFNFDVSFSDTGMKKAVLIRRYIKQRPALLPLLAALAQYGRTTFFRLEEKKQQQPLIESSFALVWLMIQYCLDRNLIRREPLEEPGPSLTEINDGDEVDFWFGVIKEVDADVKNFHIGEIFLKFFKHYSRPDSSVSDPVTAQPVLDRSNITEFSNIILGGFQALSMSRSLEFLLSSASVGQLRKTYRISAVITAHLLHSLDYLPQRLALVANVRAKFIERRRSQLRLELSGTRDAVKNAEKELNKMTAHYRALPRSTKSFFLIGSNQIQFDGSASQSDLIQYQTYEDVHHVQHHDLPLLKPALISADPAQKPRFLDFHSAFTRQMEMFSSGDTEGPFGGIDLTEIYDSAGDWMGAYVESPELASLKFCIRFGRIYVMHVSPEAKAERLSIADLQSQLQKGERSLAALKNRFQKLPDQERGKAAKPQMPRDDTLPDYSKFPARRSFFPYVAISKEKVVKLLLSEGFEPLTDDPTDHFSMAVKVGSQELTYKLDLEGELLEVKKRSVRYLVFEVKAQGPKGDNKEVDVRYALQLDQTVLLDPMPTNILTEEGDCYVVETGLVGQAYLLRKIISRRFKRDNVTAEVSTVTSFKKEKGKFVREGEQCELEFAPPNNELLCWSPEWLYNLWTLGLEFRQKLEGASS